MCMPTVHGPELLGAAALVVNRNYFADAAGLLSHTDNTLADDLSGQLATHERRLAGCELTLLTSRSNQPCRCGIAATDTRVVVSAFHEKVSDPPGSCVNGALDVFDPPLLGGLIARHGPPSDFSTEVPLRPLGRIQSWHAEKPCLDIGTTEALATGQQRISAGKTEC